MPLAETVREDGLRIISKTLPTKRVHIAIMAGVGSAYDPPGQDGLFHFFEHMAFKGTETKSGLDIDNIKGRYFLESNAGTGRTETTYWGEVVYPHFQKACSLLFDLYQNPVFPEDEIEKEKEVVLLEVARNKDNDTYQAHYILNNMLWRDNPLKSYGAGTPEGINSLTKNLLIDTHQKWHVPSNTTIIGVGKLEHEDLKEQTSLMIPFNDAKTSHLEWDHETYLPPIQKEAVIEKPGREKSIVIVGCKVPSSDPKTITSMSLLNAMLGKGNDSMLWQEIRAKRGMAYTVSAAYSGIHSLGYSFTFSAEVTPERTQEAKTLITDIVTNHPLSSALFEQKKESTYDKLLVYLENPSAWHEIIQYVIVDRGENLSSLNNYTQKRKQLIKSITLEEIDVLRKKLITPDRLATVIVKPA